MTDAQRFAVTSVDDSGPIQQVSGQGIDRIEGAERLQPFGLTGVPKEGEGLVLCLTADHGLAIVDDPSSRPTGLSAGDVTIYDGHGNRIDLRSGGITIIAETGTFAKVKVDGGGEIKIGTAGAIDVTASASQNITLATSAGGEVHLGGAVAINQVLKYTEMDIYLTALENAYNSHTHPPSPPAPVSPIPQLVPHTPTMASNVVKVSA